MISRIFIFITLLISPFFAFCQQEADSIKKEILTVGFGPQINTFFGDISPNSSLKIFTNNKPAISFDIEKRFGKVIGLQVMLISGKLADHNFPDNFSTNFLKTNLNFVFNTDNYFDNKHNFSIYSALGFGIINFDSKTDKYQGDTITYNVNSFRDYYYETPLEAGISLLTPISVGFKWKLSPYLQGRIFGSFNALFSDNIDGKIEKNNDSYCSLGFTINYAFHKITKIKTEKISIDLEDFDLSDEDKDGVIDLEDRCHHTPKNVKVDLNGCPIDTDKDGVPDYKDVQPNSKYILHVDEFGRSLTDSLIYFRAVGSDSIEIELNKTFSIDTSARDSLKIDSLNIKRFINDSIKKPKIEPLPIEDMNFNYFTKPENWFLSSVFKKVKINKIFYSLRTNARKEDLITCSIY